MENGKYYISKPGKFNLSITYQEMQKLKGMKRRSECVSTC